MLLQSARKQLSDFRPPRNSDGEYSSDPFTWPLLCLAPDMGPDMVCGAYALLYREKSKINLQIDFDISHGLNNAAKCALRHRVDLQGRFVFVGHPCAPPAHPYTCLAQIRLSAWGPRAHLHALVLVGPLVAKSSCPGPGCGHAWFSLHSCIARGWGSSERRHRAFLGI
eukprot:900873-Pyramimonas_sp.AAC.1